MTLTTPELLTTDQRKRVAETLGCTNAELDERLQKCAAAALSEHLDMYLGRTRFSRASDYLEYRLLQLIKSGVFTVPANQAVADLFGLKPAEASSLIANVYTKYRFELTTALDELLKQTVEAAEIDANNAARFVLTISSRAIADALNARLLRYGGGRARISLVPRSQTRYAIDKASLLTLVDKLGAKKPAGT